MYDQEERRKEAIKNGGYYSQNGTWNSIITFPNDNKLYRERVETIVVRDGKEVFVKKKINGDYFLPGGSTSKDKTDLSQAIAECQEEAKINVTDIRFSGITYRVSNVIPEWVKNNNLEIGWNGSYNKIYTATYKSRYTGFIDKVDKDSFILSGKWYPISDCIKFFRKEHRDALNEYIKNNKISFNEKENITEESAVTTYFKNKKFLKKISKNVDVERENILLVISMLKKEYHRLNSKSNIRREKESKDVSSIFHPVSTLNFGDGCEIAFALCFDEKEFSPGAAFSTKEYGYVVVVYPSFFKNTSREDMVFILLHEVGHIRLHHLDNDKLMKKYGDYRINKMYSKATNAPYPEVSADLYAVLNGAKLYTLLNQTVKKDSDKEYDYRFTNAELASRYATVFNKYRSLTESSNEYISRYNIASETLYEMIDDIDVLTESAKSRLYDILFEYSIIGRIKNNELYKSIIENYTGTEFDISLESLRASLYDGTFEDSDMIDKNDIKSYYAIRCQYKKEFAADLMDSLGEKEFVEFRESKESPLMVEYMVESLTVAQRNKIPTSKFGIPELRLFPLDTKKHVRSAVTLFHKADDKYKAELAKNILDAIEDFNLDIEISDDSELGKYK